MRRPHPAPTQRCMLRPNQVDTDVLPVSMRFSLSRARFTAGLARGNRDTDPCESSKLDQGLTVRGISAIQVVDRAINHRVESSARRGLTFRSWKSANCFSQKQILRRQLPHEGVAPTAAVDPRPTRRNTWSGHNVEELRGRTARRT